MRYVAAILMLSVTLSAQPAEAPTVSEEQLLRISVYELRAENIALKVASLQAEFAKLQSDAAAYLKSLEKPGYILRKNEANQWIYTPNAIK